MKKDNMNLWWRIWCVAVIGFFLMLTMSLTGCSAEPVQQEDIRFQRVHSEFKLGGLDFSVIEDTETGVQYLFVYNHRGSGLTVMPEVEPGEEVPVVEPEPAPAPEIVPEEPVEPEQPKLDSLGYFVVTAYCACEKCCGEWSDGFTFTGTKATQGRTIAVDPDVIPLGSTVYFDGMDGLTSGFVAEDIGGSINGNHIDLFFESHEDALQWGIREREIFTVR